LGETRIPILGSSERGICLRGVFELNERFIRCEETLGGRAAAEEKVPCEEPAILKSEERFSRGEYGFVDLQRSD